MQMGPQLISSVMAGNFNRDTQHVLAEATMQLIPAFTTSGGYS